MTVTPTGVPIEEPASTRIGSSRKGGEGQRIATARKILRSLRGEMPWEVQKLTSDISFQNKAHPPVGKKSEERPSPSPRSGSFKLAPIEGTHTSPLSPQPPDALSPDHDGTLADFPLPSLHPPVEAEPRLNPEEPHLQQASVLPPVDMPPSIPPEIGLPQHLVETAFANMGIPTVPPAAQQASGGRRHEGEAPEDPDAQLPPGKPYEAPDTDGEADRNEEGELEGLKEGLLAAAGGSQGGGLPQSMVDSAFASLGLSTGAPPADTSVAAGDSLVPESGVDTAAEASAVELPFSDAKAEEGHVGRIEAEIDQAPAPEAGKESSTRVAPGEPLEAEVPPAADPSAGKQDTRKDEPEAAATAAIEVAAPPAEAVQVKFTVVTVQHTEIASSESRAAVAAPQPSPSMGDADRSLATAVAAPGAPEGGAASGVTVALFVTGEEAKPVVVELEVVEVDTQLPETTAADDVEGHAHRSPPPPPRVSVDLRVIGEDSLPAVAEPQVPEESPDSPLMLLSLTDEEAESSDLVLNVVKETSEKVLVTLTATGEEAKPVVAEVMVVEEESEGVSVSLSWVEGRQPEELEAAVGTNESAMAPHSEPRVSVTLSVLEEGAVLDAAELPPQGQAQADVGGTETSVTGAELLGNEALVTVSLLATGEEAKPVVLRLEAVSPQQVSAVGSVADPEKVSTALSLKGETDAGGSEGAERVMVELRVVAVTDDIAAVPPVSRGISRANTEAASIDISPIDEEASSAAELTDRLLNAACAMDEDAASLPEVVRASALMGVVLLMDDDPREAPVKLGTAVGLHETWLEASSPVVEMVRLFHAAASIPGISATGFSPADADSLTSSVVALHGPDSRQHSRTAAQAAWLLLLNGHFEAARRQLEKASQLLYSWNGPHSPAVEVCKLLSEEAAAYTHSHPHAHSQPQAHTSHAEDETSSAAELTDRLLNAACTMDEDAASLPEVVRASALMGVVLLMDDDPREALVRLQAAVQLHETWLEASSPAVEMVRLFHAAASIPGINAMGFSPADADSLTSSVVALHGPDSRQHSRTAAQAAWLLLLNGHFEAARRQLEKASQLLYSWNGPHSPAVEVCKLLSDEAAAYTHSHPHAQAQAQAHTSHAEDETSAAAELTDRLLNAACTMDEDAASLPEVVRASALMGVVLLMDDDPREAAVKLGTAVGLHETWLEASSPVVEMVRLFHAAASIPGINAMGFSPADADSLTSSVVALHGPDSRQHSRTAAQAAWLLLLNGHFEAARRQLEKASQLLYSWNGPHSPAVEVCKLLSEEAAAYTHSQPQAHTSHAEDETSSAAELTDRLLNAACTMDEDAASLPEVVRASALMGVVLLMDDDPQEALVRLQAAVQLHETWLEASSPVVEMVRLFHAAASIPGINAMGFVPADADSLTSSVVALHGPDSRQHSRTAAQAAWLLLLNGHGEAARRQLEKASQLLYSWNGPHSPAVEVCKLLLGEAAGHHKPPKNLQNAVEQADALLDLACNCSDGFVPDAANKLVLQAVSRHLEGFMDQGQTLLKEAYDLIQSTLGDDCPTLSVIDVLTGAAEIVQDWNGDFIPEAARQKLQAVREETGVDSRQYADTLCQVCNAPPPPPPPRRPPWRCPHQASVVFHDALALFVPPRLPAPLLCPLCCPSHSF